MWKLDRLGHSVNNLADLELVRVRELETENSQLKRMYANLAREGIDTTTTGKLYVTFMGALHRALKKNNYDKLIGIWNNF